MMLKWQTQTLKWWWHSRWEQCVGCSFWPKVFGIAKSPFVVWEERSCSPHSRLSRIIQPGVWEAMCSERAGTDDERCPRTATHIFARVFACHEDLSTLFRLKPLFGGDCEISPLGRQGRLLQRNIVNAFGTNYAKGCSGVAKCKGSVVPGLATAVCQTKRENIPQETSRFLQRHQSWQFFSRRQCKTIKLCLQQNLLYQVSTFHKTAVQLRGKSHTSFEFWHRTSEAS